MDSSLSSSSSSSSSKKRLWSSEEDKTLIGRVQEHGPRNWNKLARISGLAKDGNSCRFHWVNHLKLEVKNKNFTEEEDNVIVKIELVSHFKIDKRTSNLLDSKGWEVRSRGRWSKIVLRLTGRTDNQDFSHEPFFEDDFHLWDSLSAFSW